MIPKIVLDTNILVSALWSSNHDSPVVRIYDALIEVLVTGNKRHFPDADFILTPSEFIALHAPLM